MRVQSKDTMRRLLNTKGIRNKPFVTPLILPPQLNKKGIKLLSHIKKVMKSVQTYVARKRLAGDCYEYK